MKKYIFLSLLSLFIVNPAFASVSSSFTLSNVPYAEWNNSEFDNLALDVTIPANNGQADILQSMSVMNLENAYNSKGIKDLYLWKDEGPVGFQGMGIDKRLGKGEWNVENGTWYWKDFNWVVPATGLRIFVTAETERIISARYFVRLVIPQLDDVNKDGLFDPGDKGVFMFSGNNGPTNAQINNIDSQLIKTLSTDIKAPKAAITNLYANYNVRVNDSYTISGLSRDNGYSSVAGVKLNIVKEGESNSTWTTAVTDRPNFERWTYGWTPSAAGKYTIKVKATDFTGNEFISEPITVNVVSSTAISTTKTSFTVDGLSAKADGKIYINTEVVVKDENGNPLANKAVEASYLRANDGYVARDTRTTNESGVLVWGIPATVSGNVVLTVIVDGKPLTQSYTISFTD